MPSTVTEPPTTIKSSGITSPGQVQAAVHTFPEDLKNLAADIKILRELRDHIISGKHAFYSVSLNSRLDSPSAHRNEGSAESPSLFHRINDTALQIQKENASVKRVSVVESAGAMTGVRRMESMTGRAKKRSLPDRLDEECDGGRNRPPRSNVDTSAAHLRKPSNRLHIGNSRSQLHDQRDSGKSHSPYQYQDPPPSDPSHRVKIHTDKFAKQRRSPSPSSYTPKRKFYLLHPDGPVPGQSKTGTAPPSANDSLDSGTRPTSGHKTPQLNAFDTYALDSNGPQRNMKTAAELQEESRNSRSPHADIKTRLEQQRQQLQSRLSLTPEPDSRFSHPARSTFALNANSHWPARGSTASSSVSSGTNDSILPPMSAPAASFGFPATTALSRSHSPVASQDSQRTQQPWNIPAGMHPMQSQWSASMQDHAVPSFSSFQQTQYPYSVPVQHMYPQTGGYYPATYQYSPNNNQYTQHYPFSSTHTAYQGPQ